MHNTCSDVIVASVKHQVINIPAQNRVLHRLKHEANVFRIDCSGEVVEKGARSIAPSRVEQLQLKLLNGV